MYVIDLDPTASILVWIISHLAPNPYGLQEGFSASSASKFEQYYNRFDCNSSNVDDLKTSEKLLFYPSRLS